VRAWRQGRRSFARKRAILPDAMSTPTFESFARVPDDALDVALGAALIAKDVDDSVDVSKLLRDLAALAGPIEGQLTGLPPKEQAERVSERFRALGFRGNVEEYHDPKNSLLSSVLARRTGIPITLTIVWCAIARSAGCQARGIGFPGHFLARLDGEGTTVIVDPFDGGRIVDETEAKMLLRRSLGAGAELHPGHFEPATPRMTLVRMLTNLKGIWANLGDHTRAFVAIDRMVTLVPDSARLLRERAAISLKLGIHDLARTDLQRIVEIDPRAPDIPDIKRRLAGMKVTPRTAPN
jgi:regulator of sirC expression with transglutaminase-like and TPR domain